MHEDLVDGHSCPCTSSECDNNNDCAMTPNNNNLLDVDGGEDTAMHDNLVDGHCCPCPSGEHNDNEDCARTPNDNNHLDEAALTMTTIDPAVYTQQSTKDGSKQIK
jgi:hypothetical protein